MKRHREALKAKHKEFYDGNYDVQVIDSDGEDATARYYRNNVWLNPQSGAEWVESRNAVITGVEHVRTLGDDVTKGAKQQAIRAKILEVWGKPQVGYEDGKCNEFHL